MIMYFIYFFFFCAAWYTGYWHGRAKQAEIDIKFIDEFSEILDSISDSEEIQALRQRFKDECSS